MFKQFLEISDHPKVNAFNSMDICNIEFKWETENSVVDSGVLLMRRMELYRGDGVAVDPIFQKKL